MLNSEQKDEMLRHDKWFSVSQHFLSGMKNATRNKSMEEYQRLLFEAGMDELMSVLAAQPVAKALLEGVVTGGGLAALRELRKCLRDQQKAGTID